MAFMKFIQGASNDGDFPTFYTTTFGSNV